MEIIQIVPRLPPVTDGVGEYAFLLAKQLRTAHDIHTVFVVCDQAWENVESGKLKSQSEDGQSQIKEPSSINYQPSTVLDGFPIYQLRERTAEHLFRVLSQPGMPPTVLLQYVGYGYDKRGCPLWLVRGLYELKSRKRKAENGKHKHISQFSLPTLAFHPERRLLTMFHELYASGPLWTSVFWTSPLQKWIAKHLLNTSDSCCTTTKNFADTLQRMSSGHFDRVPSFPVFSNVGEPEHVLPLERRKRQMVVFGSAIWRKRIYEEHVKALTHACHILQVEKIVDVGEPTQLKINLTLPLEEMGRQPAPIISRWLAESMAGFLTYFDDSLAKSGVFAAYCAHAVLPVLACHSASDSDGITADSEYVAALDVQEHITEAEMQTVANNAIAWYRKHSLQETAMNTAMLLLQYQPTALDM
jgi:hypothetical protein